MEKELESVFKRIRLLEDWKEALFIRLSYLSVSEDTSPEKENERRISQLSTNYTIDNIEMQLNVLYQTFENARYALV